MDFIGLPFSLTFIEAGIQLVNISILDDELVEQIEQIQLTLTALTQGMIVTNPDTAIILITDDDGEILYTVELCLLIHLFCVL